jgi:hypothetical protein
MKIYIVTTSEQDYDDQYYHFDLGTSAGYIDFVHIDLDRAIAYAKLRIESLYEEFEYNYLEEIEWEQYTTKSGSELSDQDKLDLLKEITHKAVKIHLYICELNDRNEANFVLRKRLIINSNTGETEETTLW